MTAKQIIIGILYWIGQVTWGIIATLVGFVATMACLAFAKGKIHRNGYGFITEVGGNWGGVSMGPFSLCGKYFQEDHECYDPFFYDEVRKHEHGHSYQNLIFGPLFFIIIGIPSAIRYWLDEYGHLKRPYEAIWFERQATKWGIAVVEWLED